MRNFGKYAGDRPTGGAMSQRIRERLEGCPVIAAVRDEEGLRE